MSRARILILVFLATQDMKLCENLGSEKRLIEVKRLLSRENGVVQPNKQEMEQIQLQVGKNRER